MKVSELLAQQSCGYAFEGCDQIRQCHLWRVVDEQVDMIVFAVEFHQFSIEVMADIRQNRLHRIQMLLLEHVASILSYEYQVNMKSKHTMPSMSQIIVSLSWSCH